MRVYVCRHATAASGEPDELRELTETGLEQARALGRDLAASPDRPAAILADETGAELRVEPLLAPGAGVEELRRAVAGIEGVVATVGHQPDCSEIALAVTGRDPGFPPGGSAPLELSPD